MCNILRASEIWTLVSICPYMPTRKARCNNTAACSEGSPGWTCQGQGPTKQRLWAAESPGFPKGRAGPGQDLPWQRRVYSGRFLRAVCTTSKSRLPRQYMNVGKKSAAMLQKQVLRQMHPPQLQPGPAGRTDRWEPAPGALSHLAGWAWGSPGLVLDGAQGQAKGQVATRLLGRAHQPLQTGLWGWGCDRGSHCQSPDARPPAPWQQQQGPAKDPAPQAPTPTASGPEAGGTGWPRVPRARLGSLHHWECLGQGQVQTGAA